MSWPVVLCRFSTQKPFESLSEFRAEYCVDDGVERRVKVSQPQEEGNDVFVEVVRLEDCHEEGQDKEGQPASNERPRDNGQGLGCFSLSLGLKGHVFFLLGRCLVVSSPVDSHTAFSLLAPSQFEGEGFAHFGRRAGVCLAGLALVLFPHRQLAVRCVYLMTARHPTTAAAVTVAERLID